MRKRFHVPERGPLAELADWMITPAMRLVATLQSDSPQLTHVWNNMKLPVSSANALDYAAMVHCNGDPDAPARTHFLDLRFHLGWWSKFVVLEPDDYNDEWFVGWLDVHRLGASQIPVSRRVRVLIGPDNVSFFGVRRSDHTQVNLRQVGEGRLGDGGPFRVMPLH